MLIYTVCDSVYAMLYDCESALPFMLLCFPRWRHPAAVEVRLALDSTSVAAYVFAFG